MLIDHIFNYEKKYSIHIGLPTDSLYYFFDYDDRSYNLNREFQHFHPFYEIHILLGSSASQIIEGSPYSLKKFDIVCLRPTLLHQLDYPEGPPVKRLVIRFRIPRQETELRNETEALLDIFHTKIPIYRFDQDHQQALFKFLNDIFQISKDQDIKNNEVFDITSLLIHNKFIEFLSYIFLNKKYNCYIPNTFDISSNKIYMITSYIHGHFSEDLSLVTLAKNFYMSTYYLSHLFKTITGFTLTNYVQMTRIRNAQQMLLFTDYKVIEIAELCGFTSFSQFNRVFNKFCRTSPSKFKASTSAEASAVLHIEELTLSH